MPSGRPESGDLRIELAEPNELFELRRADLETGSPTLASRIDRIRSELSAASPRTPSRIQILLPREYVTPRTERGIREAVARYCEIGISRVDNDLKAINRDGRQALWLGLVILAASLALSQVVLKSSLPTGIRDFFGNGLFLVAAWVGMWYPLDMLIYAGRPHRTERKLLRTIRGLELAVRSADAVAP